MFLTITSFSSFHSLNPYLAIIFLSTNISVASLFKSGFTVMPLYMSIFFILIFSYISLNILNALSISFCLPLSFAVPFRAFVCMSLYCTFLCLGYTTTFQFYYSCFFLVLYSGHQIFLLFSSNISFLLLYLFFYTLYI